MPLTLITQATFRRFLLKQGVIREKRGECPPPVPKEVLQAFQTNGKPTPKEHPNLLDWQSPFSSPWNTQAIYLLVDNFTKEINSGQHPDIRLKLEDLSKDQMVTWCTSKLRRTREKYRDALPPDPQSHETPEEKSKRVKLRDLETENKNRRRQRKAQVCLHIRR